MLLSPVLISALPPKAERSIESDPKAYVIPCLSSRAEIPDSVVKVLSLTSFRTNKKATNESAVRVLFAYSDACFVGGLSCTSGFNHPTIRGRSSFPAARVSWSGHGLTLPSKDRHASLSARLHLIVNLPGYNPFLHHRTFRPLGRIHLFSFYIVLLFWMLWNNRIFRRKTLSFLHHFHILQLCYCS